MTECEYCHRAGHVWFQCPKKPDGWKPERLAKRSTERKNMAVANAVAPVAKVDFEDSASDAKLAVDTKPKRKDTRKGDRHSPGYMAKYMREYRAKLKAQKEMGK